MDRLRLMATVDFVGSTTGPDSLGDKDHEGHPGKTQLTLASRWLNIYTPDIVTLIIGNE